MGPQHLLWPGLSYFVYGPRLYFISEKRAKLTLMHLRPLHGLALLVTGISLGSVLLVKEYRGAGPAGNPEGLLKVLMGDSRLLFANYFFTKANVYLHDGYYPTMFDEKKAKGKT